MRKPDYISTEQTRYQPTTIDKVEADIGFNVRKKMNVEDMYQDKIIVVLTYNMLNKQIWIKIWQ